MVTATARAASMEVRPAPTENPLLFGTASAARAGSAASRLNPRTGRHLLATGARMNWNARPACFTMDHRASWPWAVTRISRSRSTSWKPTTPSMTRHLKTPAAAMIWASARRARASRWAWTLHSSWRRAHGHPLSRWAEHVKSTRRPR